MMTSKRIAIAILWATTLWIGCRQSNEATVHGVVTLDDKPLSSGTVTFHSPDGKNLASGSIGPDGNYEFSIGKTRGLPAGEYVATVVAYETLNRQAATVMAMPKIITPARYAKPQSSDLKETVHRGDNVLNLGLKAKKG
jgi:hypothetical protein